MSPALGQKNKSFHKYYAGWLICRMRGGMRGKMKQIIKSYLVFASFLYKILLLLVLPVVLLGIQVFASAALQGTTIPLSIFMLILVEVPGDILVLGGIQEKNSEKMDYLKTSPRGMKVMKNVLVMDLVRRFLACVIIFALSRLIMSAFGAAPEAEKLAGPGALLLAVLLSYTLAVLGIFISRFCSLLWINLLCSYIGAIAGIILFFIGAGNYFPLLLPMMNAALGILAVGLSILTVKIAMMKVEGSYYDR